MSGIEDSPLRDRLRAAVEAVYDRHDHQRPLNHVNVMEWVEAVESVLASVAVTYQSPGGRSLTRCCCGQTTARLIICPMHPKSGL